MEESLLSEIQPGKHDHGSLSDSSWVPAFLRSQLRGSIELDHSLSRLVGTAGSSLFKGVVQ